MWAQFFACDLRCRAGRKVIRYRLQLGGSFSRRKGHWFRRYVSFLPLGLLVRLPPSGTGRRAMRKLFEKRVMTLFAQRVFRR